MRASAMRLSSSVVKGSEKLTPPLAKNAARNELRRQRKLNAHLVHQANLHPNLKHYLKVNPHNVHLTGPQLFTGQVVHKKMPRTASVRVERRFRHSKYRQKMIHRSTKYLIHDEGELAQVGDTVMFIAAGRHSKRKNFEYVMTTRKDPARTKLREIVKEKFGKEELGDESLIHLRA